MTSPTSPFVTKLDLSKTNQLLQDLKDQDFSITHPPHTHFAAQKKGINCTLYTSGKLVVQGKEAALFIEFYLEPKILGTFTYTHPLAHLNLTSRIGIDESGKGDFFGPLCVAGVYVKPEDFAALQTIGVKDSKLFDRQDHLQASAFDSKTMHGSNCKDQSPKYNEIYANFKNLNSLLAWGHATTIEKLVERSGCQEVIIDQFANEWVVEQALRRKKLKVQLTQRHRGEEDIVVAAASIVARYAFIEGLDQLGQTLQIDLPKGSSQAVQKAGLTILNQWGEETLRNICKQHFKTLDLILGKGRK